MQTVIEKFASTREEISNLFHKHVLWNVSDFKVMRMTSKVGADEMSWMRHSLPARALDRAATLTRQGATLRHSRVFRALHLNESPYPPSLRAVEAMSLAAASMNRYPDPSAQLLCKELAARTAIAPSRIVCGNGSEELIQVLCTLGAGPGDNVVVPAPSFPTIALSVGLRGATAIRVRLDDRGANDADALLQAIDAQTRLVFCCTPNPPSGGMMDAKAVEKLIQGVPQNVLLVMDEAYHEFGRHDGGPDILAALQRRQGPWVNLRTFSKAYGLAGVRVGYAFCSSDDIADAIRRMKTTYGPSAVALAGALAALNDDDYLAKTLDAIAHERKRMIDGFMALGLHPLPSSANFVSVALPLPAELALAKLHERGIQVRDWRDPDYQQEIRITVGLPEDIDAVIQALKEILTELPVVSSAQQVHCQ